MSASLSQTEVKKRLKEEAALVEQGLEDCLTRFAMPEGLRAAMRYSLMAGGKRIRPVLCLVSARLFGLTEKAVMPFAAALECIHTYSLIHDDLPAMDDDDLRRGKPSCHKQFDEATAILAGDGLLTDAFALMSLTDAPPARVMASMARVAVAAGSQGMVGGQFLDMRYTARKDVSLEELAAMHAMKTGAMLRVSCACGPVLAGADETAVARMEAFGRALGAAFQIMDDILDEVGDEKELGKPVGSDASEGKNTYPSLLGLEKSRLLAEEQCNEAVAALEEFNGPEADLLRGLAVYVVNRVS